MVGDRILVPREWSALFCRPVRSHAPLMLALLVVGTALGGLLVGYEPVGADPDRLYRPLKCELARALKHHRLPFWSTRFGLGAPLIAESHVAAFYPPNLLLYRVFDVSTAYRLSMWIHYVALVATIYLYARCLSLSAWGGALAGVAFALCGFMSTHASHEPFYCVMPYLPLALLLTELSMSTGRAIWLALLAGCLGIQWTLGHFQLQMWTGALVVVTALGRVSLDRISWARALAVVIATGWGAALAAVQLGPSWYLAATVGQIDRSPSQLMFYSFPPAHWFEPVLPWLIRAISNGPEDPYWSGQQTWGYEAAFYVGTIPLVFASIGALGRPASRSAGLWRILVPLGFALATMPRWWPQGYLRLLALPGIGYFRSPARYTLFTSFGLAILAGEGLDRSISKMRFRAGLFAALVLGVCAAAAAWSWTSRADVHLRSVGGDPTGGLLWAAASWLATLAVVMAWRARRLPWWIPVIVTGLELGLLFFNGATRWGWAVELPSQSPTITALLARSPTCPVGGEIENVPVRVGLPTGYPYLGFGQPDPNKALVLSQRTALYLGNSLDLSEFKATVAMLWLKRCRVEYLISSHRSLASFGQVVARYEDPALDQLVHRDLADPPRRIWSIIKLDDPVPEAHVALRAETIANRADLVVRLCVGDDPDLAMFLAEDAVPARAEAASAQVESWDGSTAKVKHSGTCDLVIARAFDAGWRADRRWPGAARLAGQWRLSSRSRSGVGHASDKTVVCPAVVLAVSCGLADRACRDRRDHCRGACDVD